MFPFTKLIGIDRVSSIPILVKSWTLNLFCVIRLSSLIEILHINFLNPYQKQRIYFVLAGISLACACGALPPCGHALRHAREHRHHGSYQFPSLVPPQRVLSSPLCVHGRPGARQVAARDRGVCRGVSGDVCTGSGMGVQDGRLSDNIHAGDRHISQT